MKKILSIVLVMLLMISVLPTGLFSITASAATEYTEGNYTYKVDNGKATITDVNEVISGDKTIPAILGGRPVTRIGNLAFEDCRYLTGITIPDSVTSVGEYAFNFCSGLSKIIISNSVTRIYSNTFYGCDGLTSIVVDEGNTIYHSNGNCIIETASKTLVFGCKTSVIPNDGSVTNIGIRAFYGCSSLTSITIPDSITSIGYGAFYDCDGLTSIVVDEGNTIYHSNRNCIIETASKTLVFGCKTSVIPNDGSVTSIGSRAFYDCSSLTSITIPNSITSISDGAFYGCSNLTAINIPNSVTSISDQVFYDCSSLTSITIPNSITSIGDSAFYNCSNLVSIIIPNSVTSIGGSAFYGCTNLESITLPFVGSSRTVTGTFQAVFGYIFGFTSSNESGTTKQHYSASDGKSCNYYIPSSLKSVTITDTAEIPYGAFYGCSRLTSIILPNNLSNIGYSAFYNCSSLTSIAIPDSVTNIYNSVFYGCSSLTSITIPDSVTSIGYGAFYGCSNLTSITIPKSVTRIDGSAFYSCSKLTSIIIPDSVTSIGDSAFYGCTNLESITLPFVGFTRTENYNERAVFGYIFGCPSQGHSTSGTTKQYYSGSSSDCYYIPSSLKIVNITDATLIPYGAFYNCSNLTSITIPNSVTSIGGKAFYNCSSLTSITIPDSVTSIGDEAFYDCSNLITITIPDGTKSIGDRVFYNTAYYNSPSNWESDFLYIGKHLIKTKDSISGAYTIEYGTLTISNCAFENCSSLTSITIPDSVTNIGSSAFYGCDSIKDVYYGFKPKKSELSIGAGNTALTNATWHYKFCDDGEHEYINNQNMTCEICWMGKKPDSPVLESKTNNTVILVPKTGLEYSKDGITWQDSNVFENLSADTTYTFYQRVKESEIAFASEASDGLSVTFKAVQTAPSAPIISSFTDTTVTLIPNANYEYSKDGTTWQTSNEFIGLSSGTKYTFYQRYDETDTHEASNKSAGTSITTDKSKQPLVPNAPTVQSFTSSSITLTPVDGCEYSKNGITWQLSNVFGGLSCGTEYTFYQRYKETTTTYVGKSSAALVTRTDKGTQTAPSAPTLENKTHNSVTLTKISDCEYSRDGINWQTSNVFTGLTPETNYMFYQRKAENDRYYVSSSSSALIVRTLEQPQYTQGDIDGAPGVTDRDAVYLLYHTFLSDIYPVNQDCDFNGDGEVNDKDAVYLLYYTFLPDLYPIN